MYVFGSEWTLSHLLHVCEYFVLIPILSGPSLVPVELILMDVDVDVECLDVVSTCKICSVNHLPIP